MQFAVLPSDPVAVRLDLDKVPDYIAVTNVEVRVRGGYSRPMPLGLPQICGPVALRLCGPTALIPWPRLGLAVRGCTLSTISADCETSPSGRTITSHGSSPLRRIPRLAQSSKKQLC